MVTSSLRAWSLAAALLFGVAPVRAQEADDEPVAVPEQAVDAYLERLGLRRLLADQLEKRLAATPRDLRIHLAERLSRLYVELLAGDSSSAERQMWEDRARALLVQVPEADSFDLRLSLGKAVYVRAEEIAERHRLRLASPEEISDAERTFRSLVSQFSDIAAKSHRRVDALERIEQQGDAVEKVVIELGDSRRQRSLAFYFAGWAHYYLGMLTKSEQPAVDATRCFGWLLNSAGGRPATPDRVQPGMLQYEHVARAAVGCGLCASLRGNDTEALRWLDAVADEERTPEAVKEQLPSRRLVVLGQAKRWADIELFIRRMRKADRQGGGPELTPLPTPIARLLAVIALEADKRTAGPQIEGLAKIALGDLVARKEVGQVLDLVSRYGTAPIGDTGFIVHYVRALQAYDQARKAHEAAITPADDPTTKPEIANQYRAAAGMFDAAEHQSDAEQFAAERSRAATMHGRSLFFAGDLLPAADAFESAFKLMGKSPAGEEPLWLAVLALERTGKEPGAPEQVRTRLNQTISLFLQNYPESDKSPRLTLMQVSLGALGDDEALKVLSAVAKDSPVYDAARRQVARILYNKFRSGRGAERDFAAARFVAVAEEVLAADRKAAIEGKAGEAGAAVERVVVRARQLLDALLSVSTPDVARADSVLKILSGVAVYNNYDLKAYLPELTFRELQMAIARNDSDGAESAASRLLSISDPGGQFHAAGERVVYRQVAAKYVPGTQPAGGTDLAQSVVKYGVKVIDRIGSDPQQMRDPGVLSVYSTVAGAALDLYKASNDMAMRDLAIRLDKAILAALPRTEASLRRLAEASESAEDWKTAAASWKTLLDAAALGTDPWMEAKYHTIRVLAKVDATKARLALDEHKVLYPNFGPEPWGPKLRELEGQIAPPSPAAPAPAAPVPPTAPAAVPTGSGGGAP